MILLLFLATPFLEAFVAEVFFDDLEVVFEEALRLDFCTVVCLCDNVLLDLLFWAPAEAYQACHQQYKQYNLLHLLAK